MMILGMGVFLASQNSNANPDYTKKTGKKCLCCHVGDWSSGQYTDAGKYYKEHRTFKDYVPQ